MDCPNCDRPIPSDSKFCIYCSAPLVQPAPVETVPATGPTQRLKAAYNVPPPAAAAPAPAPVPVTMPRRTKRAKHKVRHRFPLPALWLIGLGILFLTDLFWPGILVLFGISSFVDQEARGKRDAGIGTLVFFSGLAVLFVTGLFWPGILVLFGLMYLLNRKGRGWSC